MGLAAGLKHLASAFLHMVGKDKQPRNSRLKQFKNGSDSASSGYSEAAQVADGRLPESPADGQLSTSAITACYSAYSSKSQRNSPNYAISADALSEDGGGARSQPMCTLRPGEAPDRNNMGLPTVSSLPVASLSPAVSVNPSSDRSIARKLRLSRLSDALFSSGSPAQSNMAMSPKPSTAGSLPTQPQPANGRQQPALGAAPCRRSQLMPLTEDLPPESPLKNFIRPRRRTVAIPSSRSITATAQQRPLPAATAVASGTSGERPSTRNPWVAPADGTGMQRRATTCHTQPQPPRPPPALTTSTAAAMAGEAPPREPPGTVSLSPAPSRRGVTAQGTPPPSSTRVYPAPSPSSSPPIRQMALSLPQPLSQPASLQVPAATMQLSQPIKMDAEEPTTVAAVQNTELRSEDFNAGLVEDTVCLPAVDDYNDVSKAVSTPPAESEVLQLPLTLPPESPSGIAITLMTPYMPVAPMMMAAIGSGDSLPEFVPKPVPSEGLIFLSPSLPEAMQPKRSRWAASDYKASCNHSGDDVVLKAYDLGGLSSFLRHQVLRELDIHSRLRHAGVVQLLAAFKEGDVLVMVQEYVRGGSLDRVRRKLGGRMTEFQALHLVLLPLLSTICYLHGSGIVHRDLKPENLLFTDGWQLKVCDYGVSVCLREERAVTRTGSREYMAPEVTVCPLKRGPEDNKDNPSLAYTAAVDVWSLGSLLYELLVGFTPFPGGPPPRKAGKGGSAGKALAFPAGVSQSAREFVRSCFEMCPEDRPTVFELMKHPWIEEAMKTAAS